MYGQVTDKLFALDAVVTDFFNVQHNADFDVHQFVFEKV